MRIASCFQQHTSLGRPLFARAFQMVYVEMTRLILTPGAPRHWWRHDVVPIDDQFRSICRSMAEIMVALVSMVLFSRMDGWAGLAVVDWCNNDVLIIHSLCSVLPSVTWRNWLRTSFIFYEERPSNEWAIHTRNVFNGDVLTIGLLTNSDLAIKVVIFNEHCVASPTI